MAELWQLNAGVLAGGYRAKSFSPVEVTQELLDRIATLDKSINSFCLIDEAATLEQARASEARWAKGAPLSVLDGVPVAIKDLLLTRGWPTLRGSRARPGLRKSCRSSRRKPVLFN